MFMFINLQYSIIQQVQHIKRKKSVWIIHRLNYSHMDNQEYTIFHVVVVHPDLLGHEPQYSASKGNLRKYSAALTHDP